jgi:hypothetical protein
MRLRPATNTGNAATARRANAVAAEAARRGAQVIYTRQVLDPQLLTARQLHWDAQLGLCRKGSWEAGLFIDPVPGSMTVTKPRFDVWQSQEFLSYLQDDPVDGFIIAGVELRCCVLLAALGQMSADTGSSSRRTWCPGWTPEMTAITPQPAACSPRSTTLPRLRLQCWRPWYREQTCDRASCSYARPASGATARC